MGPFHKQLELRSAGRPLWSASSAKTPVKLPPRLLRGTEIKAASSHCGISTLSFMKNLHLRKNILVSRNLNTKYFKFAFKVPLVNGCATSSLNTKVKRVEREEGGEGHLKDARAFS